MAPTIGRNAIVQFAASGGAIVGAAYIDGLRFTPSTSVGCQIPPFNQVVGTAAQTSIGVAMDIIVDAAFSSGIGSGTSVPVSYINPINNQMIYDNWTKT